MIAAFAMFDPEGLGFVTVGTLRRALHDLTSFPEEDIEELLRVAAGDPDEEDDEEGEDDEDGDDAARARGGGGGGGGGGDGDSSTLGEEPGVKKERGRSRSEGGGDATARGDSGGSRSYHDTYSSAVAHPGTHESRAEIAEGPAPAPPKKARRPSHLLDSSPRRRDQSEKPLDDDMLIDYEAYVELLLSV
jgi:hypothetical protein